MADLENDNVEELARETENELMTSAFEKPEAEEQPKAERARDPETGRFTKAESAPAPTEQTAPQSEGQAEEAPAAKPEDEILPSWRAREINEERRAAVAELERMRVEHARLQAYLQSQQRAAQPEQQKPPPDPVLDPAGYDVYREQRAMEREQRLQAQFAHERLNMNLELAHLRHGEHFEKAFEALVVEGQRGNNQLVRHLVSQANPGSAIMNWWQQRELLREVGPDYAAYKKKTREQTREELLNDPEFLAEVEERRRQQALGGQPGKPNTVVRMPPSLSKATGSAEAPQTATDGSESQLFAYAMNSKRR